MKTRWQKMMPDGSVRYYTAAIERDLFDLIVRCEWGTLGTKRGGAKSYVAASLADAEVILAGIKKRRHSRGYQIAPQGKKC